jgi:tRNA(adenine34) deaminase
MNECDLHFMSCALDLAKKAYSMNEVPVGAVITQNNRIIGEGYNQSITNNDPTAHAEIVAIRAASHCVQNYRLTDCNMYVTLEPCTMCAGALVHSRFKKVFFSTSEPRAGAIISNLKFLDQDFLNHKVEYEFGILEKESSNLLQNFFKQKRKYKAV